MQYIENMRTNLLDKYLNSELNGCTVQQITDDMLKYFEENPLPVGHNVTSTYVKYEVTVETDTGMFVVDIRNHKIAHDLADSINNGTRMYRNKWQKYWRKNAKAFTSDAIIVVNYSMITKPCIGKVNVDIKISKGD